MDTTKEIPSFNLYEYKGSPNVSVFDGYMATLCGFCLFSAINYAAIKLGPPSSLKGDVWRWRNTFVSWVHAVIVGTGVLYCLFFKPEMTEDMVLFCDSFIYALVAFSLGYFIYDFLDYAANQKIISNYEVILHHVGVLWAFGYNIQHRINVPYTVVALMTEVNSIFLHARKLMQFTQWPFDHWLYRMVVGLNLVTFVRFRIWAIFLIGWAIYTEWFRFTLVYRVFIISTMIVMYLVNPVLLWRLFKNDILRGFRQRVTNVNVNGSVLSKDNPSTVKS